MYILLTEKDWHLTLLEQLKDRYKSDCDWLLINNRDAFTMERLQELKPQAVFIPHWSYIIDSAIYEQFECVVFHMTDLPYGRGGSPLQNLVSRGHETTMISALRVTEAVDAGDIYLKSPLSLAGTATEVFLRTVPVIFEMITQIIDHNIQPQPQAGSPVFFKRRKPKDSDILPLEDIAALFRHIQMLDGEGYPKAFLETEQFRFEFSRASLKSDKEIIADVRILKK